MPDIIDTQDTREVDCPKVQGNRRIQMSYAQYLQDESSLKGACPEEIYYPRTVDELAAAVRKLSAQKTPFIVSGGRTGITGGAVPLHAEAIISTERIVAKPVVKAGPDLQAWTVTVGAGTRLKDLNAALQGGNYAAAGKPPKNLFFPVDPTETSATIGGMIATNASGARTLYYGPTRNWVTGLRVVLADGTLLSLRRGEHHARGGGFEIRRKQGDTTWIPVEAVTLPAVKHAAGYHLGSGMDLIDLFIGGEGTLGIVAEADLLCSETAAENLYLSLYLRHRDGLSGALPRRTGHAGVSTPAETGRISALVNEIKGAAEPAPIAMEYMDRKSMEILLAYRREIGESSGVPELPEDLSGTLYLEFPLHSNSDFNRIYAQITPILAKHGLSAEESWAGFGRKDLDAMKAFRHALPERINSIIAARKRDLPSLTKVGTDMAVPDNYLGAMMDAYAGSLDAESLEYCIFGHIGNGHVHVNILPRSEEELDAAWRLYDEFARSAVGYGGSVAAEHGIGRLKRKYMRIQFKERELQAMQAVKQALDPQGVLNPGIMLP